MLHDSMRDHEKLEASKPFLCKESVDTKTKFFIKPRNSIFQRHTINKFLAAILIVSLFGNMVLILLLFSTENERSSVTQKTKFAGLAFDTHATWQHYTKYSSHNLTEAAGHWDAIDIDKGVIALSYDYVNERGLPTSQPFPWDQSKGIFLVNGYHNLHCLKSIHQFIRENELNTTRSIPLQHVLHCLDSLRMDTICAADDTPRWIQPGIEHAVESGNNQSRQCRDWTKLEEWVEQHHSCFARIDETYQCKNQMERYKFCPEGSPYQHIMHEYFRVVMGRELPAVVPKPRGQPGMCGTSKNVRGGDIDGVSK